jgi:hypothetical protein
MWSRVTQTLCSGYPGEETNTRCIVFGLTRPGSSTRSTRLEAITITIIHKRYAYRVIIHHLISYSTDCGTYWDFLDRRLLLIRKLLNEEELLCVLSGKVEVIKLKKNVDIKSSAHDAFLE